MTSTLVRTMRRSVLARGLRQPLRVDRGLHVLDRTRPAREARLRGPAGRQHALEARGHGRDLRPSLVRRGVRRLLEPPRRRREGDRRGLVLDGRYGAPRLGRRPLDRRPGGRHDHLRRRERASARGRGRPCGASRRARGRGDRRADERLGQRVSAIVVGEATAEELDAHCLASTLARFKRPREYRFVDSLPKSPSGKILRRMLRDETTARGMSDLRRVPARARRGARRRDDHARRPRQAEPRLDGRARPARDGLRRARTRTRRCVRSSSQGRAASSRPAATSRASSNARRGRSRSSRGTSPRPSAARSR